MSAKLTRLLILSLLTAAATACQAPQDTQQQEALTAPETVEETSD